jgi:DDE superfamily endonuclease
MSRNVANCQRLQKLCDDAEVILDFLPPYSPDFNPIEKAFAELKAWMRKNNQLQDAYANFEGFLEAGLMYMSNKMGNHFKSCHILVPERPDVEA